MKTKEFIDKRLVNKLTEHTVIGIDIGSRTGKAVLFHKGEWYFAKVGTGFDMQMTANELLEDLFEQAGIKQGDVEYVVGTGYGRVSMDFGKTPAQMVSEISCHGMGVHFLDADTRTIIDIGGQDSKAIKVDVDTGKVTDFIMNDKCAAGTGRFLEKVAAILEVPTEELGTIALQSRNQVEINSQCVVFAESEIISLRASGESVADIASGIHHAAASRTCTLVKRVGLEPGLQFSGGVSDNIGMRKAMEDILGEKIKILPIDMIYAGCLGAAIYALKYLTIAKSSIEIIKNSARNDFSEVTEAIASAKKSYQAKEDGKKRTAYTCSYTPLELLEAADTRHMRLFQAGNSEEVAKGELKTQSLFCDVIKSCIGLFETKNPLYQSIDRMFTFSTCAGMQMMAQALDNDYVHTEIFQVPRIADREDAREEFVREMRSFRNALEEFTGNVISEDTIKEKIHLYNEVKKRLIRISELRKRNKPPIRGEEFLELVRGYYYLKPEDYIPMLDNIYEKLRAVPDNSKRTIRLMMIGGIVSEGDRRLIEMIEEDIGARVVVEDHCTGLSSVAKLHDEEGDPVEVLANGYLDQAPCARMQPIEKRIEYAVKRAEEYKVDGIIYAYMKFCPCYGIMKTKFVDAFREIHKPVLELAIDYSKSDEGQIKTRLDAYIEVLLDILAEKEAEDGRAAV